MKILGISGSTRKPEQSGTYKLVETVLEATGCEYELISLRGKNISPCIACLGCVENNVCAVKDDMTDLRDKFLQADAYVIGAPNYYSGINAITHAMLERLYQFRHRENDVLWGKLAVAIGVGGLDGSICCDQIANFMNYSFIETVARVSGRGAACCYTCGFGETCHVGAVVAIHGADYKIVPEDIPDVTKQPKVMTAAREAGKLLAQRLITNHDRKAVTEKMQRKMIDKFEQST